MKILLLIMMLYCHIIDDYYLQGILASMKQKRWWKEQTSSNRYKYDYIVALVEHAFSWTVSIHIPILIYCYLNNSFIESFFSLKMFLLMWFIHAIVDNAKANLQSLNLIEDQLIHICQIVFLWLIYVCNV